MNEESAFRDALEADPCDAVTRRVYADWLEESGRDDDAARQRFMARDAWVKARRRMAELAETWGVGYEELMEAGAVGDLEYAGEDASFSEEEEFWGLWCALTGEDRPAHPLDEFCGCGGDEYDESDEGDGCAC